MANFISVTLFGNTIPTIINLDRVVAIDVRWEGVFTVKLHVTGNSAYELYESDNQADAIAFLDQFLINVGLVDEEPETTPEPISDLPIDPSAVAVITFFLSHAKEKYNEYMKFSDPEDPENDDSNSEDISFDAGRADGWEEAAAWWEKLLLSALEKEGSLL
jgi:hypothetical protein